MAERKTVYDRFAVNIGGTTRRERLEGRDHLVVPAAMLAEGVWNGSGGPLYYPAEELAASVPSWNHKPIVVYHPKDKDGNHVSACEPNIINTRKVGVILNTKCDDKLRTECWFDVERTRQIDARILKALESGRQIEGSTGVIVDNEETTGQWNGADYSGVARNYRPDHYAALPDQRGAYGIADGGGILTVHAAPAAAEPERVQMILSRSAREALASIGVQVVRNELSFDDIRRQLSDLLSEKYGKPGQYWDGYIVDAYADSSRVVFRYCEDGQPSKTYAIGFKVGENDTVSLVGEAAEVERVVEYRDVKNAAGVPVNSAGTEVQQTGDTTMAFDRKAHLDSLIGNGWGDADRAFLEKLNDDQLALVTPKKKETPTTPVVTGNGAVVKPAGGTPSMAELIAAVQGGDMTKTISIANGIQQANVTPAVTPAVKPVTYEDMIANSSPETRANLQKQAELANRWVKFEGEQKDLLVKRIKANARVPFTEEFLKAKSLDELQGLAVALAPADEGEVRTPAMFALGGVGGEQIGNTAAEPEPDLIPPPSMGD